MAEPPCIKALRIQAEPYRIRPGQHHWAKGFYVWRHDGGGDWKREAFRGQIEEAYSYILDRLVRFALKPRAVSKPTPKTSIVFIHELTYDELIEFADGAEMYSAYLYTMRGDHVGSVYHDEDAYIARLWAKELLERPV